MLYHTDFSQARLMDATLANAYLGDANLTKADLLRTNLSGAKLFTTNLTGARLDGANPGSVSRRNHQPGVLRLREQRWFQKPETLYRDSSTTARDVALVKLLRPSLKSDNGSS
jgi:Pentapeptide repeats (8 copies)